MRPRGAAAGTVGDLASDTVRTPEELRSRTDMHDGLKGTIKNESAKGIYVYRIDDQWAKAVLIMPGEEVAFAVGTRNYADGFRIDTMTGRAVFAITVER
ncbi:MAG: hypothetical protein WCP28_09250 [Actinomycetes bacterium]